MGLGHVPPGPLPQGGDGALVQGRQHRGAGAGGPALAADHRTALGAFGERAAALAYRRWGHRVVATNLRRAEAEADLLVVDPMGRRVLVEVKTVRGGDPFLRVDPAKERTLAGLAAALGASRIDVVGVVVGGGGVTLHAVHGW